MGLSLTLAWRNIWRHPRRTGLTLAAIVFSDVLLVWMIALQLGQYDMMISNTLRTFTGYAQIQAKAYLDKPQIYRTVPDAMNLARRMRETLGTQGVSVRAVGFALVSSEQRSYGAQIVGVEPAFEPKVSTIPGFIKQGRYLSSNGGEGAIIGSAMARNLKIGIGDELTLLGSGRDGSIAATVVNVVGVFESNVSEIDRYLVQIPIGSFQSVFSMHGGAHMLVVGSDESERVSENMAKLQALLPAEQKLVLRSWDELEPGLKQAIQADFISAWFMYAVLVLIVTFSVLNTFLMSVLERTREFGIMLALGLTPKKLIRLVILESSVMAVLGMVLGMLLGVLLTLYFVIHGFSYPGLEDMAKQFNIPPHVYPKLNAAAIGMGPGIIFVSTMIAAIYPALRIRRLQPVDAMQTV